MVQSKTYLGVAISGFILPFISVISVIFFFVISINTLIKENIVVLINRDKTVTYLLFTVIIFITISSLNASNPIQSLLVSFNLYPFLLIFFCCSSNKTIYDPRNLFIPLFLSSIPVIIFTFLEVIFDCYGQFNLDNITNINSVIAFDKRAVSVFNNPNFLSSYLVIILGIALGLFITYSQNKSLKIFNNKYHIYPLVIQIYIWLICFGIIASFSRNGLITGSILLLTSFLIQRKNLFFYLFCFSTLISRTILREIMVKSPDSLSISPVLNGIDLRLDIWNFAVSLFHEKPITGWGLGNFKFLYQSDIFNKNIPHAHNIWLMLLSETGLLGFISMNLLIGYILFKGIKTLKICSENDKVILISCLLGFLGVSLFHLWDCTFFDARTNLLSWINLSGINYLQIKYTSPK